MHSMNCSRDSQVPIQIRKQENWTKKLDRGRRFVCIYPLIAVDRARGRKNDSVTAIAVVRVFQLRLCNLRIRPGMALVVLSLATGSTPHSTIPLRSWCLWDPVDHHMRTASVHLVWVDQPRVHGATVNTFSLLVSQHFDACLPLNFERDQHGLKLIISS